MTTGLNTAAYVATGIEMRKLFDDRAAEYSPIFPTMCWETDSDGKFEEYAKAGGVSGMTRREGEIAFDRMRAATFQVKNEEYVNGMEVEKNDIDDSQNRTPIYRSLIPKMATEGMAHPDELLFTLIDNAETLPCWDGQPLISENHSWGDSGTQSNDLSLNVADPTAPTSIECRAAYNALVAAMLSYKNDKGKLFVRPTAKPLDGLILVVPTIALQLAFDLAINSAVRATFEDNRQLYRPNEIRPLVMLSNTTKIQLIRVSTPEERPFMFQRRKPLNRWVVGQNDPKMRVLQFGCDARYVLVPNLWSSIVQIELT